MVVITIIVLISIIALPTVIPAVRHRQVSEAARVLQGALAGARDKAIHTGQPSGIRLLPDPAYPLAWTPTGQLYPFTTLAYNRVVPIDPAPNYTDGSLSVFPDGSGGSSQYPASITGGRRCLVLEESVVDPTTGAPNPPTNWFWNIRVGERIQIRNSGPWYTIVGPITMGPAQGNTEQFINIGPPGTPLPTLVGGNPCEFLLLVNGRDDNNNGWIDEGFDGIDNDGNGQTDELQEWEQEQWLGNIGP